MTRLAFLLAALMGPALASTPAAAFWPLTEMQSSTITSAAVGGGEPGGGRSTGDAYVPPEDIDYQKRCWDAGGTPIAEIQPDGRPGFRCYFG
jgi:hypothetical protein